MHNKVMGQTRTGFTKVYAQSLSAAVTLTSDLEIWFLSSHDDHLCQIIYKSHHVLLSYGPDTILEYTNTHTHGQGKLYMPFCQFMAGA